MDLISIIKSCGLIGLNCYDLSVEVDILQGLPSFEIVGLPDASVKESRERVRSAIKNSGYDFPIKKIVVNLSPADTRKEGPVYDLPIAIGILASTGLIPKENLACHSFLGELSLDGSLKSIRGLLPCALSFEKKTDETLVIPEANKIEASFVKNADIAYASSLKEVVSYLVGDNDLHKCVGSVELDSDIIYPHDFKDVKGQSLAKRGLEIAAAGGHNILMNGPPGSGKSLLSKCIPSILPKLSYEECLEITKIYSVAGLLHKAPYYVKDRPFRSPHHTASQISLIGGGRDLRPGEVSLAHYGVLFLDEVPEFSKKTLEVLRQPLEDGQVTISRATGSVTFPSRVMLVCSMNPCPCGYYGDNDKECSCSTRQIHQYNSKLSGPLLDRIDIHINVSGVNYDDLTISNSENSERIRFRVNRARSIQATRLYGLGLNTNSEMSGKLVEEHCVLDEKCQTLMKNAFLRYKFSARSYHKILKVSRTIADLEESDRIKVNHLAEAIQFNKSEGV